MQLAASACEYSSSLQANIAAAMQPQSAGAQKSESTHRERCVQQGGAKAATTEYCPAHTTATTHALRIRFS